MSSARRRLTLAFRLAAALMLGAPAALLAQQPVPQPVPRPTADTARPRPAPPRTAADSARADSLRARGDSVPLMEWLEPDSTMRELLERQGFSKTRYEGGDLTFDARNKGLDVRAGDLKRVAIQRDSQLVVSDSVVRYDEQTGIVRVRSTPGGVIVLRDPTSGQGDLVVRDGEAEYNLKERGARATNVEIAVNEGGQTWYVKGSIARVLLPDSLGRAFGRGATTYVVGGQMTSCDDTLSGPDYKFVFKEFKRTGKNTIVGRPAILYIKDIPVMWLPFIFQDVRSGRRSGILTPQFGLSDIVRNSPSYRRQIEDIGYYWALNEYMDAQVGFDWRSGAGGDERVADPGWTKYKAEMRYRWLSRYISGEIATDHTRQPGGFRNTALSWRHQQEFSRNSSITSSINYVTNTQLQQRNTFNPYATLATIASSVNYQHKLGPAALALGATQKQYPGREQVDRTLPTLSFTTSALRIGEWLSWTPSLNFSSSAILKSDQAGAAANLFDIDSLTGLARLDSLGQPLRRRLLGDSRSTTASFDTPLQLFGFDLRNAFRFSDIANDFPRTNRVYVDINDTVQVERIFARTFRSEVDWNPSFALPSFSQGKWNLAPSVNFTNVDPSPFTVRTELSGGRWVSQSKRPNFSIGVSPTIFGLFPGFGPFTRLRHSLNPTLGYNYAPKAEVGDDFLRAIGRTRVGYLGSLAQNALSFGLSTNIEGKVRAFNDTNPDAGEKLKLLSLQFTPFTYDFERLAHPGIDRSTGLERQRRAINGLTTSRFGYTARSDLLPGVDFQVDYSLFEGDPMTSDTARFDPYRERVSASFQISRESNPFAVLAKLFGRPVDRPATPGQGTVQPQPDEDAQRRFANQPVAGSRRRDMQQLVVAPTKGWQAAFTFSSSRQRPLKNGSNVIELDPYRACEPQRSRDPVLYEICVNTLRSSPSTETPIPTTTLGGPVIRQPAMTTLGAQTSLAITRHWSASWNTTYDFQQHDFASQIVSLQRELHDWNAVFAFTQSPNGNFAFTFFIALKAQPDLKLDYARASYRSGERR